MPKARMDAFSDGVFAIVVTLLVLDLDVPEDGEHLLSALGAAWASYPGYVVSFVFAAGVWLAHADLTWFMKQGDAVFMRLNLALLFFVSFVPFTTSLLAEHLGDAGERPAVVIFGLDLLLASLILSGLAAYVGRHSELAADEAGAGEARAFIHRRWSGLALMTIATAIGLLMPTVALVLCLVAALLLIFEPLARVGYQRLLGLS